MKKCLAIFFLFMLSLPFSLFAMTDEDKVFFDYRIGGLISLGVGATWNDFTHTKYDEPSNPGKIEKKGQAIFPALDFKVGGSFYYFQGYLFGKASFIDGGSSVDDSYLTDRHALIGIGTTIFLEPDSNSFYVNGGVGFIANTKGFFIGIGQELSRYFSVELSLVKGEYEKEMQIGRVKADFLSLMFTINLTLYLGPDKVYKAVR